MRRTLVYVSIFGKRGPQIETMLVTRDDNIHTGKVRSVFSSGAHRNMIVYNATSNSGLVPMNVLPQGLTYGQA